jgi:hypothetical protein
LTFGTVPLWPSWAGPGLVVTALAPKEKYEGDAISLVDGRTSRLSRRSSRSFESEAPIVISDRVRDRFVRAFDHPAKPNAAQGHLLAAKSKSIPTWP